MSELHGCQEFQALSQQLDRRGFMKGVMALGGGLVITAGEGLTYAMAQPGDATGCVVTISMRGGMDGLMAVPLLGSSLLKNYRPTTTLSDSEALPLDGMFGFHKNLSFLKGLYDKGELAVVHAVGTPIGTRSHFDDQRAVEFAAYDTPLTQGGWQTRFLKAAGREEVLSGFSASRTLPTSFNNSPQAVAFQALADIELTAVGRSKQDYINLLKQMHSSRNSVWSAAAKTSLMASERLSGVSSSSSVIYPDNPFASRLSLLASLLKAGLPIKSANVEFQGDLDVHDDAGIRTGVMADNFTRLDTALSAFRSDLAATWSDVTLVTVTEFGRRLRENASAGLDHGWASAMFVMGGMVRGGQIITKWPGLEAANLVNGDLKVTTDYRDVLASVLRDGAGLSTEGLRYVFPSYQPQDLKLIRP
jgi:uncharacterized protein (DUF1501 family)